MSSYLELNSQSNTQKALTVVFLLNKTPFPTKIVFLKRAEWKKFAPGLYTGIGGHVDEGEIPMKGAYRELKEETGISRLKLHEFARCIISRESVTIHYYWSVYKANNLPKCTEGTLEWVPAKEILTKPIITTTKLVLEEWMRRKYSANTKFTLYTKPQAEIGNFMKREVGKIMEGLQ